MLPSRKRQHVPEEEAPSDDEAREKRQRQEKLAPMEEMEPTPIEEEQPQVDAAGSHEDVNQRKGEERSKKRSRGVKHRDSHGQRAGNNRGRRKQKYGVT